METTARYPHSIESERAVLGGMLLGASSMIDVSMVLCADDFYRDSHGRLYDIITNMINQNEPIELASVVQKIIASDIAEEVGGIQYVTNLLSQVASSHNLEYYANIVKENATRRRLLKNMQEVLARTISHSDELPELLDYAESKLFEVTQDQSNRDWQAISQVVDDEFERIQNLMLNPLEVTGISTGFSDLNTMLAGFHRSDLAVLAARPAMGKTALALNLAVNAAKTGVGVGFFSLEMSAGQLVTRLLSVEGGVSAGKVKRGTISKADDLPKLVDAADILHVLPIHLDDTAGLNITQLRSKARRLASNTPNLGLIIVDYIGLMSGDSRHSRQEQVSASSRGLKALAKELNVCVLALSQLNRGVESRTDKRPLPSDLRESGAIEQDADVIMFIYRDVIYNSDTPRPDIAEVIIAKHRNGPCGTVELYFNGQFFRFDDYLDTGEYH